MDLSNSVENEYFCLKLTAALGLPSTNVEMRTFGNNRVLIVERFDRHWTKDKRLLRLPQEDCCQALSIPPTLKYENEGGPGIRAILNLFKGSDTPEDDQRQFLKAVIVFWLLGATDGHAKNFSVFLSPGGRFRMTPLYDVISAQPSLDAGQVRRNQMKLAMAVGNSRHYAIHTIMPRHFIQSAAQVGVSAAMLEQIFEDIYIQASKAIEQVRRALPMDFPGAISTSIIDGFNARLERLAI